MKSTGIKQLDEAQMLLKKEHDESGLQFLLIGFKEEKILGAAMSGSVLNVGAALGLMAHEDHRFETILDIASKRLEFLKKRRGG